MRRVIYRAKDESSHEALAIFKELLLAELLDPSRTLWMVSPWISDLVVTSNFGGQFDGVAEWPTRSIRLSGLLLDIAGMGTTVVIATTSSPTNAAFLRNLRNGAAERGLEERVVVVVDAEDRLHEKALTGDSFVLSGSMNFTNNGVRVNSERISLTTDRQEVAEARLANHDRFGGVLE